MRQLWQKRKLQGDIVDITPSVSELCTIQKSHFDLITRGDEIKEWLTLNPTQQFVILDDIDDFDTDLQPFYFQTEWSKGITPDIADNIIAFFKTHQVSPFLENRLRQKTKGKQILYFDINGTLLDENDMPKKSLINRRLETVLKSKNFDYYACVSSYSDMVAQRFNYTKKPSKIEQKESIWLLLKDIFTDKDDFIEKLILIYNTDRKGEYINFDSDWYYLDDWADKFYGEVYGIAQYDKMIKQEKIHLTQHDGNGEDILVWLEKIEYIKSSNHKMIK